MESWADMPGSAMVAIFKLFITCNMGAWAGRYDMQPE